VWRHCKRSNLDGFPPGAEREFRTNTSARWGDTQVIREAIAKLKEFSKGQTLGGLKIKDLIKKGQR